MTNRPFINDIISESPNGKILGEVFSDHFDSLTNPVFVSLGLSLENKNIQDIVNILRENGINALPFYNPKVKEDMSCFVVDGTGVRSPILSPQDAIKATKDLFEIMHKNEINTSRALPVCQKNMIPAIARAYDNKIIDIISNNPNEKNISEFLSQQLELAQKTPSVDFEIRKRDGKKCLYRGGTLGDKPYAITPHQRRRDGVYASNDINTATEYADGKKGNGFSFANVDAQGKGRISYGFLYEFEESEGQRFYGMAEIENPSGSEECKGRSENRPDYETLIVPDRNPLKAIYLKAGDKVIQIADENGYLSENWKKFTKLHTPYNTNEKNDYMVERINRQVTEFLPVEYKRENTPLQKDISELQFDGLVFGKDIAKNQDGSCVVNNACLSSMIPKNLNNTQFKGGFNLDNCIIPQETNKLNLSQCTGFVGISNSDLSSVKDIIAPESCNIFFLENVKLAEGSTLDLSQMKCNSIVFRNQNLSKLNALKLPEGVNIQYKDNTTLPNNPNTTSQIAEGKAKITRLPQQTTNRINVLRGLSPQMKSPYKPQKIKVDIQTLKHYQGKKLNG